MKKLYLKPIVDVVIIESSSLVCASDDIVSPKGVNYGGVDTGGTKDPEAREILIDESITSSNFWDEW